MLNKIRQRIALVSYGRVKWGLRTSIAIIAMLAILLSTTGVFAIPTPGGSHPVAVGPVSGDTGFPTWYKDSNGTRLELCLDGGLNPLCGFLPGDIPNPDAPITVPDNFPVDGEAFWMLGTSLMTTDATGGSAILVLGLEAAFQSPQIIAGDQVSFGRVRIWIDNLISGANYKVTHPYGFDNFTADAGPGGTGRRSIRWVEDIGIGAPGDFTGALNSRIGPFLVWDPAVLPAAPVGYIGDPNVNHSVVGSPFNTNFFRVEGPAGSFPGSPNQCADPALGDDPVATDDCIQTSEFSLLGKYATNAGVNAIRATYSRSTDLNGSLDAFAFSENGQSIEVVRGANFATTLMTGDGSGRYYARVGFDGATPPASLTIRNASDVPAATKNISVTDLVTITKAEYNTDTNTLTVEANSSDLFLNPVLTAVGYGALTAGSLTANAGIAPDVVTVTSAQGGSDTAHVYVVGGNDASAPIVAGIAVPTGQAVPPIPPDTTLAFNIQQGQLITLDGSSSSGDIDAYAWTQVSGPVVALSGANTAAASFTSPSFVGTLEFQLTVTRNSPSAFDTKNVTINVQELQAPLANAGPDQLNIVVGSLVTLDGTGSQNVGAYSWTQILNVGDPAVVINSADTAHPTFTLPNYANPLTFELTVINAAGSATDTVLVQRTPDTLTNIRPQFIRSKNDWKITGTAQILGIPAGPGNTVRAYLGVYANEAAAIAANRFIGEGQVDGAGTWAIVNRAVGPTLRAVAGDSITLFSTRGAYQVVFVEIK